MIYIPVLCNISSDCSPSPFSSIHPFFSHSMSCLPFVANATIMLPWYFRVETQGPTGSTTVIVIWAAAADEIMSVQSHNWIGIGLGFDITDQRTRIHASHEREMVQIYNCGWQKGSQYVPKRTPCI